MRKLYNFHNQGNTWKYTLDVYKLRICWFRMKKTNSINKKISLIGMNWG